MKTILFKTEKTVKMGTGSDSDLVRGLVLTKKDIRIQYDHKVQILIFVCKFENTALWRNEIMVILSFIILEK